MKVDDVNRLEDWVSNANPVPDTDVVIDSEESIAVTLVLSQAAEMDVPGLLPAPPEPRLRPSPDDEAKLLERGRTMDTLERNPVQETKPPVRRRTAAVAFAAVVLVAVVIGVGSLIISDGGDGDIAASARVAPPDITFIDPDALIFSHEATIRQAIEETYAQAEPLLNVDGVAFTVSLEIYGLPIADYGVGYSMADANTVVVAIDPWMPQLGEVLSERVPVMVASALYDVARGRGDASNETFFEAMVWSGLADHFAEELLGGPPAPWTDAFPLTRTEEFFERAQPLFDIRWDDRFDADLPFAERGAAEAAFDEWFDLGGTDIPRWSGFTLGYRLIETYLAENPGQTALDLVKTPASVFRP